MKKRLISITLVTSFVLVFVLIVGFSIYGEQRHYHRLAAMGPSPASNSGSTIDVANATGWTNGAAKFFVIYTWDFDVDIYSIEQWARDSFLIFGNC